MDTNTHIAYNPLIRTGLFILIVVAALFLAAATTNQLRRAPLASQQVPSISVSGTGEVFAIPDTALLTFDVSKEAKDVAAAQKLVNDIVTPIVSDLKDKGIAEKDIKTLSYTSYPVYDYKPNQNQVLRGYQVTESIQIKIRKTDTSGDILSYLGSKGVTNLSGINFVIDDEDNVKAEARSKAIDAAKEKAQVLADQLGVRLVRITSFSEDGSYPYPMYDRVMMSGATKAEVAPAPATVPQGENKYTSNVTVTYEIR